MADIEIVPFEQAHNIVALKTGDPFFFGMLKRTELVDGLFALIRDPRTQGLETLHMFGLDDISR